MHSASRNDVLLLLCRLPALPDDDAELIRRVLLPEFMLEEICRFQRSQDRLARIYARLLLASGLHRSGLGTRETLADWCRTPAGRPFFRGGGVDFSLSYSDGLVACALSGDARVGVDVERYTDVTPSDFFDVLPGFSNASVAAATDPVRETVRQWSRFEAVLKADGRGLGYEAPRQSRAAFIGVPGSGGLICEAAAGPYGSMSYDAEKGIVVLDGTAWHMCEFSFPAEGAFSLADSSHRDGGWCLHLAASCSAQVRVVEVREDELVR